MKKQVMRKVTVVFCDVCDKEISPPYRTLNYNDGSRKDLCIYPKNGEDLSCAEKQTKFDNETENVFE